MNVATNVKYLADSILFQLLWAVYASPSSVLLSGPGFINFLVKIINLSGQSNATEVRAICEFQARRIHPQSFFMFRGRVY
jgi:hypothetical protein